MKPKKAKKKVGFLSFLQVRQMIFKVATMRQFAPGRHSGSTLQLNPPKPFSFLEVAAV